MLKDEIEKLICEGYLRDYIRNGSAKLHNDQNEARPPYEIRTIFGGPHLAGETRKPKTAIFEKQKKDRS